MLPLFRFGVRSAGVLEKSTAAFPVLRSNLLDGSRSVSEVSRVLLLGSNLPNNTTLVAREYSKYAKSQKKQQSKYKSSSESASSSDSDTELLGHRGESEFWRRKMRTFHGILDVNKDGVISYDDFKLLADRFVNLGHLTEHKSQEFQNVIKDLWEQLWGEITPYNLVTVERYLEDMHHVLNDKPLKKKAHAFLPYLFKAIDKSKQGKIEIEDFKLFFKCLGLTEQDAILSFRVIDTNGDGKLTLKEFVSHGRQFFLTEDQQCISKYFWGPLIEH